MFTSNLFLNHRTTHQNFMKTDYGIILEDLKLRDAFYCSEINKKGYCFKYIFRKKYDLTLRTTLPTSNMCQPTVTKKGGQNSNAYI